MVDDDRAAPGSLLHGVLDLCLLALLAAERDYGYGLTQRLGEAGLGAVPGGTLYPALLRLERGGLVEVSREASESGPPRKYYSITGPGLAVLADRTSRWQAFSGSVQGLLAVVPARVPADPDPARPRSRRSR